MNSEIQQLIDLAGTIYDNNEPSTNTHHLVGSAFLRVAAFLSSFRDGFFAGYRLLTTVSELPTSNLTERDKNMLYLVGSEAYIYVGQDGDTAGGLYKHAGQWASASGVAGLSLDLLKGVGSSASASLYPQLVIGSFADMTALQTRLDETIASTDVKYNGILRATVGSTPYIIFQQSLAASQSVWVQVVIGALKVSEGVLQKSDAFDIAVRKSSAAGVTTPWKSFSPTVTTESMEDYAVTSRKIANESVMPYHLDASLKTSLETGHRPFSGFVHGVTVETNALHFYDAIVFDRTSSRFIARRAGRYSSVWPGNGEYNHADSARTDRIFSYNQRLYIFTGGSLQDVAAEVETDSAVHNRGRVMLFHGIVNTASVELVGVNDYNPDVDPIFYCVTQKKFLMRRDGKYYVAFMAENGHAPGDTLYHRELVPRTDVIFKCTSGTESAGLYYWDTVTGQLERCEIMRDECVEMRHLSEEVRTKVDYNNGIIPRFAGIVNNVELVSYSVSGTDRKKIFFDNTRKVFLYKAEEGVPPYAPKYSRNWSNADEYMLKNRTRPIADKLFTCTGTLHLYNAENNELEIYGG